MRGAYPAVVRCAGVRKRIGGLVPFLVGIIRCVDIWPCGPGGGVRRFGGCSHSTRGLVCVVWGSPAAGGLSIQVRAAERSRGPRWSVTLVHVRFFGS